MTKTVSTKKERSFFKLLMIIAYVSTLSFSLFFYFHEVYILAYNGFFCLTLFVIFGISSSFTSNLVWLFRLSVLTSFHAFYFQIYFTGGVLSPSLTEFLIPPVIAFFYKPVRERYYFMIFAVICALSIWLLSTLGYTENRFPQECSTEISVASSFFVFAVVGLYIYLYRKALNTKNRELQHSYQQLLESEKMASLGLLSAGVAHEINNPLNFIKGGIEMLTIQLQKSEEAQPYVHAVEEGVERVASIVNSLAHFSRESPAKNEVCDIQRIIDNCLVMLNHRLKYKAEVITEFDDLGILRIIGNEGQLHQAILNLITNAEQAIDEGGVITIRTYTERGAIKVAISDNGCGIDPEHLDKIREIFFTTKTPGVGTGLGLAITYKIIEEHDGSIDVTSEPGKGTTFYLTFKKPITFESA